MEIKEITDRSEWDAEAQKYPKATFIDSWNWGEFEVARGFKFKRFAVVEGDQVLALLPVKTIHAIRGRYIFLRHAPLMDWGNAETVEFVLQFLERYCREEKCHFIRFSPLVENSEKNNEIFMKHGYKPASSHAVDAELAIVLDLEKDDETLLAEMRKNTRYAIRKAVKMGVVTTKTQSMDRFEIFWDIFKDSAKRNKWDTAYPRDYVEKEYKIFAKDDQAVMFFAEYKGESIAAAIFTYFNGQMVYHHSGSLTKYRDVPSMYLLLWEAAQHARSLGLKKFNLWGISPTEDKNHAWYGLSLFKRGFGGDEVEMLHARDKVLHPWAYATRTYEYLENRFLKGH